MKHTHLIPSLLLALTLISCTHRQQSVRDRSDLAGAWVLRHVEYPSGTEEDYSMQGDGTSCLIYDHENRLYACNISTTPTGLLVKPTAATTVTLVDKGGGEWLYLEDGDPHPLRVSDSTITIQRMGILYTYASADDLYREWGDDIRDIIDSQPARAKDWDDFRKNNASSPAFRIFNARIASCLRKNDYLCRRNP